MTQGVTGCPVTAQLIKIFGEDWKKCNSRVVSENRNEKKDRKL
jgi:hypothetical protein